MFNLPFYRASCLAAQIAYQFGKNKNFNVRSFDEKIANLLTASSNNRPKLKPSRIAYLATVCYDIGGHTKCIKNLAKSLNGYYEQRLFLTQKSETEISATNTIKIISQFMSIDGIDALLFPKFEEKVKNFADRIIDFSPKTLLVYIHPDDVFGVAVMALLKKTTDIKIVFFNHASHYPCLGMSFSDDILEAIPTTEKVTQKQRGLKNTKIIGIQSLAKNETIYYSKYELTELKEKLGIPVDNLLTMSGGSAYKFFDNDKTSEYFNFIRHLLTKDQNIFHVIISHFNNKQKAVIENIFSLVPNIRKRLIIIPYNTNFDKYFQMADVFIDSFPVSSALTQIDLMRNKVATVVKINHKVPCFSFHEYQMPNYPYMFEKVEDMENAILELLHNEQKRNVIIQKNYNFWLKTYESDIFRDKIIQLIEGEKDEY